MGAQSSNFEVTDVTAPDTERGDILEVTAEIENTGNAGDTQNIQLAINGTSGPSPGKLDIAFLIDESGSMGDEIEEVRDATQEFAATVEQDADARFGVVTFAAGFGGGSDGVEVQQEFTDDVAQVQSTIGDIADNTGGVTELNYDAIDQTINDDSVLSPRSDARLVLIDLTDEDTDIRTDSAGNILTPNGGALKNDMESQDVAYFGVTAATKADLANGGDLNEPSFEFDGYKKFLAENVSDGEFFDLNAQDLSDKFENEIAEAVRNKSDTQQVQLDPGQQSDNLDILFTFDTTGSMSDEISGAQDSIVEFTQEVEDAGVDARYGLIEFKADPNSVQIRQDLTSNVGAVQSAINSLSAGGAGDEESFRAMKTAIEDTNRRSSAKPVVIHITDAPSDTPPTRFDTASTLNAADARLICACSTDEDSPSSPAEDVIAMTEDDVGDSRHIQLGSGDFGDQLTDEIADAVTETQVIFDVQTDDLAPGDYDVTVMSEDDSATTTTTILPSSGGGSDAAVESGDVRVSSTGETGESAITVDAENGVSIAQLEVSIDTSVAEITNVQEGADVDSSQPATNFDVVDQTADSVRIEFSNIQAQANPVQDFELARVEFEAQTDDGEAPIGVAEDGLIDGNQNEYATVNENEGTFSVGAALFTEPLPGFSNPPTNTQQLNPTLYEDISGNGDGLDPSQTVTLWTELVLNPQDFNDLTQEQVDALDWNGDGSLSPADAVSLWTEQVLNRN